MDAAQALSDLTEISSQIQAAVVLESDGSALASTLDEARSKELAQAVQELLAAVEPVSGDDRKLAQLEVSTSEGSVFVVKGEGRTIAATTAPEPTVGLVFYDLKSCLRAAAPEEAKPARRSRKKSEDGAGA